MATVKITSATSRFTSGILQAAFGLTPGDDTAGADALIVDPSAYLITTGVGAPGAWLLPTGAWTATVNGSIVSDQSTGILIQGGNAASSKITVGKEGSVYGGFIGISALSGATISNSGVIISDDIGINLGSASAHTITNALGAFLSGSNFAIFDNDGLSNDKVTNFGEIDGSISLGGGNDTLTNSGRAAANVGQLIDMGEGNDTLTNSGEIEDVDLGNGNNTFKNTGTARDVLGGTGIDKFTSSKNIDGQVSLGDGNNIIVNSGEIFRTLLTGSGNDVVTNSGKILGNIVAGASVALGNGANKLTNTGTIGDTESVSTGSGNDVFSNGGLVLGTVDLGSGNNVLTNSSKGRFEDTITFGSGDDKFTNAGFAGGTLDFGEGTNALTNLSSGKIDAIATFGSGDDTVTNAGTISTLVLGEGNNTLTNSGTVVFLIAGSGDDIVNNKGQILSSFAQLGAGNDTFNGGGKVDRVVDDKGTDTIKLGAGDDVYFAVNLGGSGDGADIVDGGLGSDFYRVGGMQSLSINLAAVAQNVGGFGILNASSAQGAEVGNDTVTGFENVGGGDAADTIYGNASANRLLGEAGDDIIAGLAGNDYIEGGDNDDSIVGGLGKDELRGGSGVDEYIYLDIKDSGTTKAARDLVAFEDGIDIFDLSAIDANKNNGTASNDTFSFIGTNVVFGGVAGELRAYWISSGQIIEGDVNGDKKADFSIEILDATHTIMLTAGDFVL